MSVLIKGVEFPNNCLCCRFNGEGMDDIIYCELLHDYFEFKKGCPLVKVPTPHGRLIDVDAIIVNRNDYYTSDDFMEAVNMLEDAPTIIEAEGEDVSD